MNSNNNDRIGSALTGTSSRRQALKLMGGGLVGGLAMATGISGATANPGKSRRGPTGGPGSLYWPLDGKIDGDPFSGQLEITRFSRKGGALTASGNVYDSNQAFVSTFSAPVENLLVTDGAGNPVYGHASSQKLASVATGRASDVSLAQDGDCQILYLTLGPIFLDLLGLIVEVPDPIVIDIRAEPGAGNLLGNLLCAVAGLLDPASNPLEDLLGQLVGLLNQILGVLGQ
jgi:hypothetical protein